ncbi:hypothetical protein JHK84_054939 [Glycine max]|nr:hypothetical protein JHK86_054915 [Glycine max]KAG5073708.1 hypothetical protein JHK84_054939 [Glycine max]
MVFHHFQDVAYTGFMFILGNLRVEMIRVPDWAFEAAGQETRSMAQDAAYHLGLYLTPAQLLPKTSALVQLPAVVSGDCIGGFW